MGEVETYTSLAPVGAVSQEYRGLLVVSKVFFSKKLTFWDANLMLVLFADFSLYSHVDYVQWRWNVMLTLWQVKSRNVFSDIGSGLKSMVSSTLKFEQSIKSIECRISGQLFLKILYEMNDDLLSEHSMIPQKR